MTLPNHHLAAGFLRSAERYPERPALQVEGVEISYRDLDERARCLAATIVAGAAQGPALTGVMAYRSAEAFAAVLGSLLAGRGYVPLNPTFPPERLRSMLERSQSRVIVIDAHGESKLEDTLRGVEQPMLVVAPHRDDCDDLQASLPGHRVVGARDLAPPSSWRPRAVSADDIAYLLFTSGSTGSPKGVMVAHRNVRRFLDVVLERYAIDCNDRFSHMFELVFDLSVFDMFAAWDRGACLCCASPADLMAPARYIRDSKLTIWFSVPSVAIHMKGLRMLEPGFYPDLRVSLFCGEALPAELARSWSEAAPSSIVENLYGPTEVTLACTLYRWDSQRSPAECENGLVPIGYPFEGMSARVVDETLHEVAPGQVGELLMAGPQVALGYWRDAERTAAAFVQPPACGELHYRTGDRVRRPNGDEPLKFIGRVDHQVQVLGHRVELGEVESVLRETAGAEAAVALGWPPTDAGVKAIEGFLAAVDVNPTSVLERVAERLPHYMTPRKIHLLESFPLNANGKIDRKALMGMLQSGALS